LLILFSAGKTSSLRVIDFGNAICQDDPDHVAPYLDSFNLQPLIYRAPEVALSHLGAISFSFHI
jgi:hypothetical protein